MVNNALIGFSGFVGSTLLKQVNFGALYRSTNISEIQMKSFHTVVCAGAPAQKWLANSEPDADLKKIEGLITHLKTIHCNTFILISTVDVFKNSTGVDEDTLVDEVDLQAYGLHRRLLEKFVESHFSNHLIIRLPGLVGSGLRKNVIFDFLNNNNLHAIESRDIFQFYPIANLWGDIQLALSLGLKLVHLTAEPVSVAKISKEGFDKPFTQVLGNKPAAYDLKTKYAKLFGGTSNYQYSARETIQAVRAYVLIEPLTIKSKTGAGK
jgi:hypothetical protein